MTVPPGVLFLCTGNSCRSQMAEGFLRRFAGDRLEVASAGTEPAGLNPLAVRVMKEAGVDISGHGSKHVRTFQGREFDYVITVCDSARESCPVLPGRRVDHWSFPDPAAAEGSEEERLSVFREVRDRVRGRVREFAHRIPASS